MTTLGGSLTGAWYQRPYAMPTSDATDPLAAVISLLRPETVLSKVISGAGRWSVRYDAHVDPGFCLMLEGSCFLDLDGIGPVRLDAGDFILLPATPGFTMASDLTVPPKRGDPRPASAMRHGTASGPPSMRQLGGYFRFSRENAALVVGLLPSVIHIRHDQPGASRVHRLVESISDETMAERPGRDLILERLVEVLLIEAIRFRPPDVDVSEKGLLAGLADPGLAPALRRMHLEVGERWTVASLARLAGMSRATFASRFTQTVGLPPMEYLLEWRLALAKDALLHDDVSLDELAERIGYQSASAFSTAFSRRVGCSPRKYARSAS